MQKRIVPRPRLAEPIPPIHMDTPVPSLHIILRLHSRQRRELNQAPLPTSVALQPTLRQLLAGLIGPNPNCCIRLRVVGKATRRFQQVRKTLRPCIRLKPVPVNWKLLQLLRRCTQSPHTLPLRTRLDSFSLALPTDFHQVALERGARVPLEHVPAALAVVRRSPLVTIRNRPRSLIPFDEPERCRARGVLQRLVQPDILVHTIEALRELSVSKIVD